MRPGLEIRRAGPACTVQDQGRDGWLRYGVTPAGPMDWIALAEANILAGNPPGAAAIEAGPGGIEVAGVGASLHLGLSAPGFRALRDGQPLPPRAAILLEPGQVLTLRPGDHGTWGYVAVGGGFDLPAVMGSHATHLRSGLGPLLALAAGMVLAAQAPGAGPEIRLPPHPRTDAPLRLILGPQDDAFTPGALARLVSADWQVASRSDRMAYRLAGPRLDHLAGHDIVSDGVPLGAIQVPGDGVPLVLMADRQPTGGYPKIATVIRADLPRLAQARPGEPLRFRAVTVTEAVEALRRAIPDARALTVPEPAGPDLAKLASGDFASGFTDGG